MITVQQLLEAKPDRILTIAEDASMQDALEIMARHTISALPVVNGAALVGMVSEQDYIRKAVPKRLAPWDVMVSDIMTREVISVSRSDPISVCMELMCKNRIRHLPVMQAGQLIGMVSISDVLRASRS